MSESRRKDKKEPRDGFDLEGGVPFIEPHELEVKSILGKGCFGTVWLGRCRGMDVAIKKLHAQELEENVMTEFKKEVSFMRQLRHPNIILFMGACSEPGKLAIVSEYLSRGDLHDVIHNTSYSLSWVRKCQMTKDIASAMTWLHNFNPKIIHRDLKPTNLLVDENWRVKVCDFGLSVCQRKEFFQDKERAIGTPLWMAPEVLLGKPLSEKVDIYSFGIVLWELFTGQEPYAEHSQYKPFVKAVCYSNERPPIPPDMYSGLGKLLEETWQPDANLRPEMKNILPRISIIMIDGIISCPVLNKMWKENWPEQAEITFSVFASKLYEELGEPRIITTYEYRCLERVVGSKDPQSEGYVVKLDRLSLVVTWFGPVHMPGQKPFLKRIENLLRQPWCFGEIDRSECERALKKGKDGDYLLRFSITDPHKSPFTISCLAPPLKSSKKKSSEIVHCRVYLDGDGYHIFKPPAAKEKLYANSIENLISTISKEKILKLKTVSNANRPYADIFSTTPDNGCYLPSPDSQSGDDD